MRRPNKKHKRLLRSILLEEDGDIVLHRIKQLPQIETSIVCEGWSSSAEFRFFNGKRFHAFWHTGKAKELKSTFRRILAYLRQQRRGQ